LSYGKIWLYRALIHSNVPRTPTCHRITRYFPTRSRSVRQTPEAHRLRREIIATALPTLDQPHGAGVPGARRTIRRRSGGDRARLQHRARVFAVRDIWAQIEASTTASRRRAVHAMFQTTRLLRHTTYWLLENRATTWISNARPALFAKSRNCSASSRVLSVTEQARLSVKRSQLIEQHVPEQLASRIASLQALHCALDLVESP